jgi:DNA-binding NarL/FixJ family response regulator
MQSAKTIRVLVVEDEPIIGMTIEDFLGDFGYSVVGPMENLKAAILLAATEQIDVANRAQNSVLVCERPQ